MFRKDRRSFLIRAGAAALCGPALPMRLFGAQARTGPDSSDLFTPTARQAVDRGLAYLASRQARHGLGRGSFGGGGGSTVHSGGVAVCGLSGLALMSGGSLPNEGPYSKHVARCVDFIIRNTRKDGFIGAPRGRDRMYGHGFATLFLAEVYGMSLRPDVGDALRKAIKLIVATQSNAGGWRYQPRKADQDLSITICQIMALRAARDAGIHVPKVTRDRCLEYVRYSQNPDGGFRYVRQRSGSSFPLTGAGLVSLYSAGIYEGEAIDKGLAYLMKHLPTKKSTAGNHYFYGHYYAAQATWHAGGEYRRRWYTAIRDKLLSTQRADGAWVDPSIGAEFGTAMACIILQIPNAFLPVFTD